MELEFLKKVFEGESIGQDLESFQVSHLKDLDISRLYCIFKAQTTKQNTILLPENFIHPLFKPQTLSINSKVNLSDFLRNLSEMNYQKVEQLFEEMQFTQRGDVITIYSNLNNIVYKVEFFDEIVEKISLVDPISLRSIQNLENLVLLNINPEQKDFLPEVYGDFTTFNTSFCIHSQKDLLGNHVVANLAFKSLPLFHKNFKVFEQFLNPYSEYEFYYSGNNWELIPDEFKKDIHGKQISRLQLPIALERGFICESKKLILFTDREILSTLNLAKAKSRLTSKFTKLFENEVNIGDFVVHEAHGIGVYRGIETKIVLGEVNDYVIIEYKDSDRLLVPLTQLDRISRYLSSNGGEPHITKLGTAEWEAVKRKLKKSVEDIAGELLEIYAKKNIQKGIKFEPDNTEQDSFESKFAYKLTDDQIKTLNEVKDDMEMEKPMDRLVIGDVGFGKTEVALRAAFKAVQSGKQVLVLAPTTVLVSQLYNVFATRFSHFNIRVARVSRFDGTQKNKENIQKANDGKVDVLIGTHRLLSNDVQIPQMGLLIIDEEQRFGVKQKEKIRKLRANIDVLSMSATPIPRTLQMALTGIKDISIIATPPKGRLAVHNEVIFKEDIASKIKAEIKRGGQVFIVHNRVEDLSTFVAEIAQKLPENIRIATGHGQMSGEKLEKIMYEFEEREYDVLIATTIIENGIDIPTVNTIIIDDAHRFGLSQLYQLRGRVGRSHVQGYCYLVLPKAKDFIKLHKNPGKYEKNLVQILEEHKIDEQWITPEAVSRVEAIIENQELGAGFKIASRDLEIRGSGNILGSQQSGQINAVGYEMFVRLLEQEITKIRKTTKAEEQV